MCSGRRTEFFRHREFLGFGPGFYLRAHMLGKFFALFPSMVKLAKALCFQNFLDGWTATVSENVNQTAG